MSRPIYGYTGPPCVQTPIDNSPLNYIRQLNTILEQLNTLKKRGLAVERLQVLLEEIDAKRDTIK